jgi:hypothetical protein
VRSLVAVLPYDLQRPLAAEGRFVPFDQRRLWRRALTPRCLETFRPKSPFWTPESHSVYTQPPSSDPPSCSFHFGSRLLAPPSSNFALSGEPETRKPRHFSGFHKHLSAPRVLVCLISRVSSPTRYPVAIASAPIRRSMLPNSRRVRYVWLGSRGTRRGCKWSVNGVYGKWSAAAQFACISTCAQA